MSAVVLAIKAATPSASRTALRLAFPGPLSSVTRRCETGRRMIPTPNSVKEAAEYRSYTSDFLNERGKKIFCYYWEPKEPPRALLMILHGFTDHAMLYESLAQEMVKRRFFVFAHDHAGHGRSEGSRAYMANMYHLVEDVEYHIGQVRKRYPVLPLFLWGHSMGGAVSFLTSLRSQAKLKGIIAVAPSLAPNPETATTLRVITAKILANLLPHFPVAYADFRLSCRNEAQIEKMTTDPLRHHGYFTARPIVCLLETGEELLRKKEFVEVPYLLLHGDSDKVCHVSGSQELHESSKSADKTLVVYPGAYHSIFQEPEDVSADAFNRTVQWLEERA